MQAGSGSSHMRRGTRDGICLFSVFFQLVPNPHPKLSSLLLVARRLTVSRRVGAPALGVIAEDHPISLSHPATTEQTIYPANALNGKLSSLILA